MPKIPYPHFGSEEVNVGLGQYGVMFRPKDKPNRKWVLIRDGLSRPMLFDDKELAQKKAAIYAADNMNLEVKMVFLDLSFEEVKD